MNYNTNNNSGFQQKHGNQTFDDGQHWKHPDPPLGSQHQQQYQQQQHFRHPRHYGNHRFIAQQHYQQPPYQHFSQQQPHTPRQSMLPYNQINFSVRTTTEHRMSTNLNFPAQMNQFCPRPPFNPTGHFNQHNISNRNRPPRFNRQPPPMGLSTFGNFQLPTPGSLPSPIGLFPPISPNTPMDAKAEYKEKMKEIVEKWIRTRNLDQESKGRFKKIKLLKIREYKDLMQKLMKKVEELRMLNDSLAESMERNSDAWTTLTNGVKKCKEDVIKLQERLLNDAQVEYISKLIKERKKKRLRQRIQKKRASEEHLKALSRRIKLNEKIDEWRHEENAKIHMEKMIETLKNEAGESLTEVKRKQTESNDLIKVFELMRQLREIRKETAIYKGIFVTEQDDERFNGKVNEATSLLRQQKQLYEDEERALRVLREEEAEDFERIEVEKRKKRKQRGEDDLSSVDPMSMFRMFWLQAEESVAGLIHVRALWDMFLCLPLTPGVSRLPESWPVLCEASNKEWAKYIKTNAKKRNPKINDSVVSEHLAD